MGVDAVEKSKLFNELRIIDRLLITRSGNAPEELWG
jgi:hypothetical protein